MRNNILFGFVIRLIWELSNNRAITNMSVTNAYIGLKSDWCSPTSFYSNRSYTGNIWHMRERYRYSDLNLAKSIKLRSE